MQLRSHGNQHLIPYINNINRLPRELRQQQEVLEAANQDQVEMDNDQENQDPPPPVRVNPPRQNRNIGAGDAPNTHAQRQGIVPPAIPNNNFEIKSSTITMIQNNKFHGLPMEDPLDHLDEFDRLCGLTKINGVSEDAYKLRLFPFSLGDKAKQWEKALPQGSITSWDDCKKAFLTKWFSNSRTAKLRNEISGFTQKNGETFCETWERFKGYTSQCPHHGFSNETLLSTLYRGVLPKFRMMLDTASNGNFLNKDVDEGWELVENLAQSDGNYNEDHDRAIRGTSDSEDKHRKEIKALNEKLDKLLLVQQKKSHTVCEAEHIQIQDGEGEITEELCYMNQGGFNRGYNYKPNPNLSYRSTNVANPQDQVYPQQQPHQVQQQTKPFIPQQQLAAPPGFPPLAPLPDANSMLQQILQGQAANKIDSAKQFAVLNHHFHELKTTVDSIDSRVSRLESNQTSTSAVKSSGQLPGKAIQNPKEFCNAVFSTDLDDGFDELDDSMNQVDFCSFTFDTSEDELVFGRDVEVKASTEEVAAIAKDAPLLVSEDSDSQDGENLLDTEEKDEKPTVEISIDVTHRPNTSIPSTLSDETPEISMEKRLSYDPPPYEPQLPFPGRKKKELIAKYRAPFDEQIKILEAKMPLSKALKYIPESHKLLKELIMERIKATQAEKLDSEECSAVVSKEEATPEKLEDPGSFILPCSLGPLTYRSLCDLGSSVSLMPLSVAQRLGYKEYTPTNISLILADRSVKKPHGVLEDLPVRVGKVKIPTDFIVLDMDEIPKDPLILGRPFLATAGAVIDVKHGKIELNLGKGLKMTFDVRNIAKKPTIEGQTFSIEVGTDPPVETSPDPSPAKDHSIHSCNAILIRDGDEVWEEEESDEDEHSEDDFSDCHGILTSNLARSRARKREKLDAETPVAEPDLPAKDLKPPSKDCSEFQALKMKCGWQEQTIRQLTMAVRELACMVKENKDQIEQLQGQTSGSASRESSHGSEFTVSGQKFKMKVDEVTPGRFSKPLLHPPEA